MKTITLTSCEFDVIDGFLSLIEKRAREPTNNKTIDVNPFSISKESKRSYNGVKKAMNNLKLKIKELNEC